MKTKLLSLSLSLVISTLAYGQSPFINKVYEYNPAPGQFTNELPKYEENDTQKELTRKAEESITGEQKIMISLGGYGGYVLFGFDHMVQNIPGKYDFKIWGNAFYSNSNPNPDASAEGGSCEPGVVSVSFDSNGNGLPDDEWYELAGSEYFKPQTIHNYQITYHRPDPNKTPQPNEDYPFLNDTTYIKWKDNQHQSGYIARNTFHAQSYFPLWTNANSITFNGTRLANNSVDESGNGSYFVQYAYRWGYADNHPNNDDLSSFDIAWAVDNEGNQVVLPGIHFVKVHTAVNQYCGWLGETSTEIMGAEDLHLQNIDINVPAFTEGIRISHSEATLTPNQSKQLSARIYSSNPSIETVVWESTDPNIATIDSEGMIIAVNLGTTTITATVGKSHYSDYCKVIVTAQASHLPDPIKATSKVITNNHTLRLIGLEAHSATIFSTNGEIKEQFFVATNDETRHFTLPSGTYILKAQNENQTQIFKVIAIRQK